jgi:hypothetical protein
MIEFLEALFHDVSDRQWVELRTMKEGVVSREWYLVSELAGLVADAMGEDLEWGYDAYFGVLPRTKHGGSKAEDVVDEVRVLWADIDGKHFPGGDADALAAIQEVDLTPSIVVSSGGGYHVYWLLRRPAPYAKAKLAMQGIAKTVGGDSVSDAPRILRIPGTHNHKYDPPRRVRLLYFTPNRKYRIEDFADYVDLARPPDPRRHNPGAVRAGGDLEQRMLDLDEWLFNLVAYARRDDGTTAEQGQRSEACFKAMLWLCRFGWSDDQILEAFRAYPTGIGAKYRDKGNDADRWFWLTLGHARDAAEEDD